MSSILVYKSGIHTGEERAVPGNDRSGMVFFSGCHLACNFCYTPETSVQRLGDVLTPSQFQARLEGLIAQGAKNLNLISPTHLWGAIETSLSNVRTYYPNTPIVLKVSGYESRGMVRRMTRLADVFVPDFKVFHTEMAQQAGLPPNYGTVASQAIRAMARSRTTLVRHLMMPNAVEDSKAVVAALIGMGFKGHLNLMTHFIHPKLGLKIASPFDVEDLRACGTAAGMQVLVNGKTMVSHVA